MLLKLTRTQKTAIGTLRADVAYTFDMDRPEQESVAHTLLARGFATRTTMEQVEKDAAEAAEIQRATLSDQAEGDTPLAAVSAAIAAENMRKIEAARAQSVEATLAASDAENAIEEARVLQETAASEAAAAKAAIAEAAQIKAQADADLAAAHAARAAADDEIASTKAGAKAGKGARG